MSVKVLAFDAIGTVFDTAALEKPLVACGFPAQARALWLAQTLREGFAHEVAGLYQAFAQVALSTLEVLAAHFGVKASRPELEAVVSHFAELPAFPDVLPAFSQAREAGFRIFLLTNGSADSTRRLVQKAGLEPHIEEIVSIDELRRWKPARAVYRHCAARAGVDFATLGLVAAHAWDVSGALQAGLQAGWVSRAEEPIYPEAWPQPHVRGQSLVEVVSHFELRR